MDCPHSIYKLMLECWSIEPQNRPTFQQLYQFFNESKESKDTPHVEHQELSWIIWPQVVVVVCVTLRKYLSHLHVDLCATVVDFISISMTLKLLKTFFHTLQVVWHRYVRTSDSAHSSIASTSRPRHNSKFRGFSDDHETKVGYSGGSFYFIPSAISVTWTG